MRKLGVEEGLVKTIKSMYRNVQSRVRVNETSKNDFLVQVVLHQGSVLNPMLFIIVMDALSK